MARFASFTDCDINNLIINKGSQNTKKQIEKQYNVFMVLQRERFDIRPRNRVKIAA